VDYIVRAQELFEDVASDDVGLLNDTCCALLAHALTTGLQWSTCTRFANGLHFSHGRLDVVEHAVQKATCEPTAPETDPRGQHAHAVSHTSYDARCAALHLFLEPLFLERFRITPLTLARLLPFLAPRYPLRVASAMRDLTSARRGHERFAHEVEDVARDMAHVVRNLGEAVGASANGAEPSAMGQPPPTPAAGAPAQAGL
jgi:hypothetical protein